MSAVELELPNSVTLFVPKCLDDPLITALEAIAASPTDATRDFTVDVAEELIGTLVVCTFCSLHYRHVGR